MSASGFFGLYDAKVAKWNSATAWGTNVDVLGVKMYGITEELVNGRHEGDDRIVAVHAKTIAVNVEIEFLFEDLSLVQVVTGRDPGSCGDDEYLVIGTDNMPYFAINGLVHAAEGASEAMEIFLPKVKIDQAGFQWSMNYGQFVTPRLQCLALYNNATYGMAFPIIRASVPTSVSIPPTWA